MNFGINLGKKFIGYGERLAVSELEKMYGKQIGRTAPNGNRTFQKVVDGKKIRTGVDRDFREIAQVTREGDRIKGSTVKIKKNADGDIVEVSHSRSATNFRKTTTENLETGEVKSKVLDIEPVEGKYKYTVTSTNIDRSGNVTQETKNVRVNGKESPLEE